ncbi:PucR family transcriptional regulator [Clostridium neuense]|uniref:PucR family transcriptional regulator n=1 Tax=Clostridium neuense TaxID=1728934 RepID=A0ABW8TKH3_9CLOT
MPLLIKNLFQLDSLTGIKLMTDQNGINNEIAWVNIMEILDEISYLQRDELLLTTGYKLDNENLNKDLIFRLHSKGLAGMGIQTGYYLNKIPKYIIDDGNKYNFPIFEIPKDLSFSIITQVVLKNAYAINIKLNNKIHSDNCKHIFESLKIDKKINFDDACHLKKSLQLNKASSLCLFILSVINTYDTLISENTLLNIINNLRNYFHGHDMLTIIEILDNKVMFLISSPKKLSAHTLSIELMHVLKATSKNESNLMLLIGGSNIFNSIENLRTAYKESCSSLLALEKIKVKTGICFYKYLSLFKTLGLINSDSYIAKSLQEKIYTLIEYDRLHNTNYFYTLKSFIDNEFNINLASEKIYIHRHTLKNRLEKMKQICDIDFDDCYSKLSLTLAIYLYELFS